jgi:hypothetical protein
MRTLTRFVRDPLLHFLAVGGLLFAVFHVVHGPAPRAAGEGKTILVDRQSLLSFMQYEAMAFKPSYFAAAFDALSAREKEALIDKYVREESLYREAAAMGLGEGDYVIRRRMIQKMLYLIDDMAAESFAPDEAALKRYFLENKDRYRVAPSLTFTHVFADGEIKREESGEMLASRLKRELQSKGVRFDEAPAYGDRFPFLQNYVDRTPDYIESQFGAAFASALAKLEPSDRAWQGPIKSDYGYHLVLLTQRMPAHLPDLSEIRDQVKDDLLRDTIAAHRDKALAELTLTYKVETQGISIGQDASASAESEHARQSR